MHITFSNTINLKSMFITFIYVCVCGAAKLKKSEIIDSFKLHEKLNFYFKTWILATRFMLTKNIAKTREIIQVIRKEISLSFLWKRKQQVKNIKKKKLNDLARVGSHITSEIEKHQQCNDQNSKLYCMCCLALIILIFIFFSLMNFNIYILNEWLDKNKWCNTESWYLLS